MRIRLKKTIAIHPAHGLVKGLVLEAHENAQRDIFGRPYYVVVAPGTEREVRIWPGECELVDEGEGDAVQEDADLD